MEACADGPGDDFTDSPTSPLKENPKPAPRRYLSQGQVQDYQGIEVTDKPDLMHQRLYLA